MPLKVSTREDAVKRYGAIDFSSKHWAKQDQWMTMIEIPDDWFPDWKIADTELPVKHVYCNSDMAGALFDALTDVYEQNLGHELKTYDGCLAIRMVRGTNDRFSAHAYGLAIDLNAALNPLGESWAPGFSTKFVDCFNKQGFSWGGAFHSRIDKMHFSRCWE